MRPSSFFLTRHPAGSRMGARASGGPRARTGFLLLLLLLGLVAPGAQGARSRGGTEKNSYRRTVNTFSQSVSSLFGEDNVRAAQKVGAGPAPAVTLLRPPRTWSPGPSWALRGLRGCRPAGLRKREARVWGVGPGLPPVARARAGPASCLGASSGAGLVRRASARPVFHAVLLLEPCSRGH